MSAGFYNTASDRDDGTAYSTSSNKYARYLQDSSILYPKVGELPLIADVTWLIERAKQATNGAKFTSVFCLGQHPKGRNKAEFGAMLFSQWWCNKHLKTTIEMYKRSFWHSERRWAELDPKYPCYGLALYHCALPYQPDSIKKVYQPSKYDLGCYENYIKKLARAREQLEAGADY